MDYRSLVAALTPRYGGSEARAIARVVMEDGFGLTLTDVLMGKDTAFMPSESQRLDEMAARLVAGEPVQHVVGHSLFCDRRFAVSPACLIPRPETEGLVALCREHAAGASTIVDLGTGSGCIAVTLALDNAGHAVFGVDVSADALAVARRNAQALGASVTWLQADMLQTELLAAQLPMTDVIVSNPPYITPAEACQMEAHVLEHEPHIALFAPAADPLCFYRAIAAIAAVRLKAGGIIAAEVNASLSEATAAIFTAAGFSAAIHADIYGHQRFVVAR